MQVKVTAASESDLAGAKQLLSPLKALFPRLKLLWGDSRAPCRGLWNSCEKQERSRELTSRTMAYLALKD